jgi:hypothetical protein
VGERPLLVGYSAWTCNDRCKCRFQIRPVDLAEIFQCRRDGFRRRCATNKINAIRVASPSIRYLRQAILNTGGKQWFLTPPS